MSLNRRNGPRAFPFVRLGLTLSLVLGCRWADVARAQAPKAKTAESQTAAPEAKRDDPKARAIFDEVSKAYKELSTYSDQGQFVVAMTAAGKSDKQVVPLKVTLVRPNKFEIDTNVVRLTSDGKTLTTSVIPLKRYMAVPAPEKVDIETFREGPIGASLFGGPSGVPMFVLLNLLTAPDPASAIAQLGGSLQLVGDSGPKSAGAKADTSALLIDLGKGAPGVLLTIDPATKLLSSIDLKIASETLKAQNVSIEKFGWASGAISTQVAKDRSFAFDAPKGFAKVDTLLEARAEAEANNSKLGKPAPDFTLSLLDGPGKTKTITRAELAGNVVVIDFWATWCGPCLKELPEIQKLIESYANTQKDVIIVALSQDDEPSEITQLRKLVEKTLADKKINLTSNSVGRIGLDPSKSVGTAFELEGYPTLVILDRKGIVASVHVGFDPEAAEPLSKTLAKEIDTLLEGKSLTSPKPQAKQAAKKSDKDHP
jgi:thiol-disulfide isomerase/thioredoxin